MINEAHLDSPQTILLASEIDIDGFRASGRRLLAAGVEPSQVHWHVAGRADGELAFAAVSPPGVAAAADAASPAAGQAVVAPPRTPAAVTPSAAPPPTVRVPAEFVALCGDVVLHNDPQRFGLLYRLLWRLVHEPPLRHDPLDADRVQAAQMAHAVRRDIHKMRAFVRFRTVDDGGDGPLHVAWFEPQHHIVEANAPFFARRFTAMRWAVLTPERSVQWDGKSLQFGPGANRGDAPAADAGEALWLTYYARIFNPARLKLRMMEKEMPRRYWRNLPEADLIAPLAAQAHQRRAAMIEQAPTLPKRRIVPTARLPSDVVLPDEPMPAHAEAADAAQPDSTVVAPPAGDATAVWHSLRERAAGCRECPLGAAATQTVWGEGRVGAALMLVGEQPGDREDLEGRPFVGPAGQLLARAMKELGWQRSSLYVTNAVKHFKYELRGKRRIHKTPAQREADACVHWLEEEIATVAPKALIALGATAARQLLRRPVAVMRERGQWLARADGRRVLVTLHPSALLRGEPAELEAAFASWVADLRKASTDAP